MKKIALTLIICLICALAVCCFAGCNDTLSTSDDSVSVVCTVFPIYDWVKNIVGDKDVDVTLLLDSGADLHSYNPTVRDMLKISQCDLFIYVGGESDEWVDRVLSSYPNENRVELNLIEALGDRAREEEEVEGMQSEEEEGEEEEEYDEHIWLSLKNAASLCDAITSKLTAIDSGNADFYAANLASYKAELTNLDGRYAEATSSATVKTLVFGDRFPFLYMMKDYGITYYAAFKGCSTEVNAAPTTIKFLSDKVNENNLKCVIAIDGSNQKIAQAVVQETNAKNQSILVLNSLQSIGKTEINNGVTYLSVMESNLATLKEALK